MRNFVYIVILILCAGTTPRLFAPPSDVFQIPSSPDSAMQCLILISHLDDSDPRTRGLNPELRGLVRADRTDSAAVAVLADGLRELHPNQEAGEARATALETHRKLSDLLKKHFAHQIDDLPLEARYEARKLQDISEKLFAQHGKQWIPNFASVTAYEFRGGEVRGATIDVARLFNRVGRNREAIDGFYSDLAKHGITKLEFSNHGAGDLALLVSTPAIGPFTHLKFSGDAFIRDEGVTLLANNPHLKNVERLDLDYNAIVPASLDRLARSPHLTKLKNFGRLDRYVAQEPINGGTTWTDLNTHERVRREAFLHMVELGDVPIRMERLRLLFPQESERARVIAAMAGDARFRRRLWEEPFSEIAGIYGMASSDPAVQKKWLEGYLAYHKHPTKLLAEMEPYLTTIRRDISIEGVFAQEILNSEAIGKNPGRSALTAIIKLSKADKSLNWNQARDRYLAATEYSPEAKAHYVLSHLTETWVEPLLGGSSPIPENQRKKLKEEIEKYSSFPIYLALAEARPDREAAIAALRKANRTSFEVHNFDFSQGAQELLLGSRENANGRQPLRTVKMTKAFAMGRTPVTRLQLALLSGEGLPRNESTHDRPAVNLDWYQANQRVVDRLNQIEREKPAGTPRYRWSLPGDDQWEFAARGGTQARYFFGDDRARYYEFASLRPGVTGGAPVARRKPNPNGLYDLFGNVAEWGTYYEAEPRGGVDPAEPRYNDNRSVRGGWFGESANRTFQAPGNNSDYIGLRLVRRPE